MQISVQADIRQATRYLNSVQKKQIPYAASQALNQVAYQTARKVMPGKADDTFDGGATAFTKRGFKYRKSNKKNLTAWVYIDQDQARYMRYQIEGGVRLPQQKYIAVPTGKAKLNKYGNVTRNTRQRYFQNSGKFTTNERGVYERVGRSGLVRKVINFVGRAVYRPKFKFYALTRAEVGRTYPQAFNRSFARAMASAR